MSFLKKFGVLLRGAIGIVSGAGPWIGRAIPGENDYRLFGKVKDTVLEIADLILIAEAMFSKVIGKAGFAKLDAASPLVSQIIQRSELMAEKEIMDEAKFIGAVRTITSGFADLLNSLKPKNLELKK